VLADESWHRRAAGVARDQGAHAPHSRRRNCAVADRRCALHGRADPGARLLELPGERLIPAAPALERTLDETEAFLHEVWESGAWDVPEPDRVIATILFTDIVGSSERAAELGDRAWREL